MTKISARSVWNTEKMKIKIWYSERFVRKLCNELRMWSWTVWNDDFEITTTQCNYTTLKSAAAVNSDSQIIVQSVIDDARVNDVVVCLRRDALTLTRMCCLSTVWSLFVARIVCKSAMTSRDWVIAMLLKSTGSHIRGAYLADCCWGWDR